MVYQSPVGARDLFPLDVAQKRWIENRLRQVFHSWGYHRIITSTLERLDTLMAGGAIEQSTVIQLQDREGEALGLRPELTASIARAAVTRMAGVSRPQRLYYNTNVFRRSLKGDHTRQQEFYQAGLELLGSSGVAADAEVLLVMMNCLTSLGLEDSYLVLGEAELTRSLLSAFPENIREKVRVAIAMLDRITLETLPLPPALRDRALLIMDLRGQPADVLQQVASLDLDEGQRAIVANLKALIELWQASWAGQSGMALVLDLSLIQTFDYYTGIVFEVVSGTIFGQRVLGQGGRYDQLLGLYHPQGETCPGIGFVLNIEELHQVLLPTGQLPVQTPASDWLVVPTTPRAYAAAFTHAQQLRNADPTVRVEMELDSRESSESVAAYAQRRRIRQIAWVNEAGVAQVEALEVAH
ncbi:MAG: ATP phosphoribosyltransferase regulatory subunit [Timaviella obliquedivisa GSE-PSE-MK23-08B]|jgi:ATP phosphoribosyltransferase regulatory subunit|nr:ATP phosphoribosyltransferase regulatory subunit [Timaviella obliquedivisa GSE-PSE-MK23-08B]